MLKWLMTSFVVQLLKRLKFIVPLRFRVTECWCSSRRMCEKSRKMIGRANNQWVVQVILRENEVHQVSTCLRVLDSWPMLARCNNLHTTIMCYVNWCVTEYYLLSQRRYESYNVKTRKQKKINASYECKDCGVGCCF